MTTYDIGSAYARTSAPRLSVRRLLALPFVRTARRREDRRMIAVLSRLEPRRLHDMGLDPEAIYDAVEGTWNEVPDRPRYPKV